MIKLRYGSVLYVLVNIVLFAISLYFILNQYSARNWETASAKIISVEPRCCHSRGEKKSVHIRYEFVFKGINRISDVISFSPLDINVHDEHEFRHTLKYKVGDEVVVYVSGDDSVLVLGINSYAILLFCLSLCMFIYGVKTNKITIRNSSVVK
jgi:hypothetical protein